MLAIDLFPFSSFFLLVMIKVIGQAIITGVSFDLPVIVKITQLPKEEAPNSSNSELLKIWQVVNDN